MVVDEHKKMFYEAARAEVLHRLNLRDQSLIAYIVSAGAYLGFVVQPHLRTTASADDIITEAAIIVVLPVLSLLFTYVILQHHIMIGRLGDYARDLYPATFGHWDHFYVGWRDRNYLSARTISQALLLTMPVAFTATFLLRNMATIRSDALLMWIVCTLILFDLLVIGVIVHLHVQAYLARRQSDYPKDNIVAHQDASVSIHGSGSSTPLRIGGRPLGKTLATISGFRAGVGGLGSVLIKGFR